MRLLSFCTSGLTLYMSGSHPSCPYKNFGDDSRLLPQPLSLSTPYIVVMSYRAILIPYYDCSANSLTLSIKCLLAINKPARPLSDRIRLLYLKRFSMGYQILLPKNCNAAKSTYNTLTTTTYTAANKGCNN